MSSFATNPGNLSTAKSGLTSTLSTVGSTLTGVVSGVTGAVATTTANALEVTIFSSRVIAIVLGLLLIGGAILLYVGEDLAGAISTGGKLAAEVAA